jgi:DNA-directed RNA polymerase specialized sigma24 family protein
MPNREELHPLVERLRAGCASKDDIDALILAHVALVESLAYRVAAKFHRKHWLADLKGDARVFLIEGINQAKTDLQDNGLTFYLTTFVTFKLNNAARNKRSAPLKPEVGREDPTQALDEPIYLDDIEREIIRLRALDYTDAEIAELLGLSQPTVNRKRRAVAKRNAERFGRVVKGPRDYGRELIKLPKPQEKPALDLEALFK